MYGEPDETEKIPDFNAYLERIQKDGVLLATDVEATIRRTSDADDLEFANLPVVPLGALTKSPRMFEMSATRLGAGGVGEVRLATQPALCRQVAVKVARVSGQQMARPERMLLREALVMGYLEHPNIVPIHVLARDESDELVVAMKRVEGDTLSHILRSRTHSLDELLDILLDVCKALDFAHQRGIVHLDLKPANVMVGPYGDTYLVDWGAAVAFRGDVPDTIPRPLNDGKVRGTPAYLAPEMVICAPPMPHTDVYLLGGLLHVILTGRPPNAGDKPEDALRSAFHGSRREYPRKLPADLIMIAERALEREPERRYGSIGEMRKALLDYRSTAAARDVHRSAQRRIDKLQETLATERDASAVYAAFGAARQLLKDAAGLYNDADRTRPDEQKLLTQMIRWELSAGDPKAALRLVHELPELDAELEHQVNQAVAAQELEMSELNELRRQMDPKVANMSKAVMFAAIGAVIAAIHVIPTALGLPTSATQVLGGHVAYLAVLAVLTAVMRDRLFATFVNRQVILLIWVLSLFGLVLRVGVALETVQLGYAIGLDLALVALVSAFGGATLDRRVWAAPAWYAAATIGCFTWPEHGTSFFAGGHFFGLLSVAIAFAVTGLRGGTEE